MPGSGIMGNINMRHSGDIMKINGTGIVVVYALLAALTLSSCHIHTAAADSGSASNKAETAAPPSGVPSGASEPAAIASGNPSGASEAAVPQIKTSAPATQPGLNSPKPAASSKAAAAASPAAHTGQTPAGFTADSGKGRSSAYSALYFLDTKTGWAVNGHSLIKTDDGGSSWAVVSSYAGELIKLDFVNEKTGWAIELMGNYSDCRILRTIDGGKNWSQQFIKSSQDQDAFPNAAIRCFDESNIFVLLKDQLLNSSNGGNSWLDITPSDPGFTMGQMSFPDVSEGWACGNVGGAAVVFHTADGGRNWSRLWSIEDGEQFSGGTTAIDFINSTTGWILLNGSDNISGRLYQTTDGGNSFHIVGDRNIARPYVMDMRFTGEYTGWIPTDHGAGPVDGGLEETVDGGRTFQNIPCDLTAVDAISFPSADVGYAIGSSDSGGGCLIGTADGGNTWKQLSDIAPTNGISFVDANEGYGIGATFNGDTVLYTADGGVSWYILGSVPNNKLTPACISFLDRRTGFILCVNDEGRDSTLPLGAAVLYATDDGGASWQKTAVLGGPFDTPGYFRMFDAQNGIVAWLYGAGSYFYTTSDGGQTWEMAAHNTLDTDKVTLCAFRSAQQGLIFYYDYAGPLSVSAYDNGIIGPPGNPVNPDLSADTWIGVSMAGDKAAAIVGIDSLSDTKSGIILSGDGGATWSSVPISNYLGSILRDANFYGTQNIDFANENDGFILIPGYSNLLCTEDGGNTWQWR